MTTNTPPVLHGIIHARVSTYSQVQNGTSLEGQIKSCLRWAEDNGITVVAVLREDGTSGALYESREHLQRGLEMIEAGKATYYITHAVDRSGRDMEVLTLLRRRVLEAGGRFVANGQEFTDTSHGTFMYQQFAAFAELERSSIRERTMGGRRRRAEEGQQPYRTFSPYGFRVVTKQDILLGLFPAGLIGTYQLVDGQWQIMTQILEKYAAGDSMYAIRQWLSCAKVPSPEGKPQWPVTTLRRLISHPAMKGEPVVNRTRRKVDEARKARGLKRIDFTVPQKESEWIRLTCTALVSAEVWDRCQARIAENQKAKGGNPKRRYPLGGMVVCPHCDPDRICGGNRVRRDARYRYYSCPKCRWNMNVTGVHERVRRSVGEMADNPQLSTSALQAFLSRRQADSPVDVLRRLREQLTESQAQEEKAVDLQIAAAMKGRSTEAYERKIEEISRRCAELGSEIAMMEGRGVPTEDPKAAGDMIAEVMRSAALVLNSPHLEDWEVNEILSSVVDRVKPTADGEEVVISLRPFFCAERR